MVEYIEANIDDLLLDENNPRLGQVPSQSKALEEIIALSHDHVRNLMLSIKENGLDPGDALYVVDSEDGEDMIVLEGNRRLSAMMILLNPDILSGVETSDAIRKSLARTAAGFDRDRVEPIRCVKFGTRDDAHDWILRRHTGTMDGEGRITWGPLEIQRFEGDRSLLDIIDFMSRNADYSLEDWDATRSVIESRKSSNLSRLLDSAAGKQHLRLSTDKSDKDKTPLLGSSPEWAIKVLRRVVEDVRDGIVDSRKLNKASDIEDYFKSLPEELQPKPSNKSAPKAFKEIQVKPPASKAVEVKAIKPKTTGVPKARSTLASKRHAFNHPPSTKGEALLREASHIDATKLTLSAAFVLRSFIDLAITDYMETHKLPKRENDARGNSVELDLAKKAERVVQHIVKGDASKNTDLRAFRNNILTKTSPTSIQSLNGFVHNKFQIPTADALRVAWDCCIPIFIEAYGPV